MDGGRPRGWARPRMWDRIYPGSMLLTDHVNLVETPRQGIHLAITNRRALRMGRTGILQQVAAVLLGHAPHRVRLRAPHVGQSFTKRAPHPWRRKVQPFGFPLTFIPILTKGNLGRGRRRLGGVDYAIRSIIYPSGVGVPKRPQLSAIHMDLPMKAM